MSRQRGNGSGKLGAVVFGTALTPAESRWFVQRGRRAAGKPEAIAWLSPERSVGVETNGQ